MMCSTFFSNENKLPSSSQKKSTFFFVNDQPDEKRISWLADRFFKSRYDISQLMRDIFTSEWFYEEKNIGVKIKSPVELIAGLQRLLPMRLENEETLLIMQRLLGQMLFYPPNVAGWAGGKTWIDSSTLMLRLRLPQLINDKDEMNISPKDDDDQMMGQHGDATAMSLKMARAAKAIIARVEWQPYLSQLAAIPREKLINTIAGFLLQTKTAVSSDLIRQYADESARENFIRSATIQLMSTPEYQLC